MGLYAGRFGLENNNRRDKETGLLYPAGDRMNQYEKDYYEALKELDELAPGAPEIPKTEKCYYKMTFSIRMCAVLCAIFPKSKILKDNLDYEIYKQSEKEIIYWQSAQLAKQFKINGFETHGSALFMPARSIHNK